MRLVEDNPSSLSLVEIYKQRCAKKGIEHDNPISRYYDRLATVQARGTQASHQVRGHRGRAGGPVGLVKWPWALVKGRLPQTICCNRTERYISTLQSLTVLYLHLQRGPDIRILRVTSWQVHLANKPGLGDGRLSPHVVFTFVWFAAGP